LRKLTAQENASQELSGETNNSDRRANYRGEKTNFEKIKRETEEALEMLM
jgi:hypothetical protein